MSTAALIHHYPGKSVIIYPRRSPEPIKSRGNKFSGGWERWRDFPAATRNPLAPPTPRPSGERPRHACRLRPCLQCARACSAARRRLEHPCAIFFLAMAKTPLLLGKRSRLHGQKTVLAPFYIYSGVNYDILCRQFNKVLTPTCMAVHGRKRFWSQAQSSLATGGFEVGHRRNRSLAGE